MYSDRFQKMVDAPLPSDEQTNHLLELQADGWWGGLSFGEKLATYRLVRQEVVDA